MRKLVVLLIMTCCLAAATSAHALVPGNMNASSSKIVTYGINNVAGDQADMLKALGLFVGTDDGFELQRRLTRAEAATLVVRFMGEEKNALAQNNKHPFKDVPGWADPYVGWLYKNKITFGIGNTLFGSSQNVTYWQFAAFLSRISIGSDEFVSAGIGTEEEQQYIDRINQDPDGTDFFRADAVSMLARFMRCIYIENTESHMTVAQFLIKKSVFTAEQFVEAGINIYPVTYMPTDGGGLSASLEGAPFAKSTLTGINGDTSYPAIEKEYFYAWKSQADKTLLYRMDCLTLQETLVAEWPRGEVPDPWKIAHFTTLNGRDLLGVWHSDGVSLMLVDNMKNEKIAEGKEFKIRGKQYYEPYIQSGDKFIVVIDDIVYVFTQDRFAAHKLGAGVRFIGVENGLAVLCSGENGQGIIAGARLDDWSTTDTYRIALPKTDMEGDFYVDVRSLILQHWGEPNDDGGAGIYGEAGLFTVQNGRLDRVTDRPVLDVGYLRVGASGSYAVLSREPESLTGSTIYQYDGPWITGRDGYAETERLGNDPAHGIEIRNIKGVDSMVFFYSKTGVGMNHYDIFTYYPFYNSEEGHMGIVVMNFTAGRPEISFAEHDAQWYVMREQERLNKLGYKPW